MDQRRVIGVVVVSAVVLAGVTAVVLRRPDSAPVSWAQGAPPPPVRSELHSLDLAPAGPRATSVDLPERDTERFSMVGITWTDPKVLPGGGVRVRTRSAGTGRWSAWRTLDTSDSQGADTAARAGRAVRGGTSPLWVGPSDAVAARVDGKTVSGLPAGLRLELIDPSEKGGRGGGQFAEPSGPSSEEPPTADPSANPSMPVTQPPAPTIPPTSEGPVTNTEPTTPATTTPTPTPTVPPIGAPLPAYVSRAGWRADESIVRGTPGYAPAVKVLFVHHTAGEAYECADSPAIVRGTLTYHVQSQGWDDIGYNFLVDKCGTLFEGRRGGVDKAVIGAHTYGFNTGSAGIAVLGTYLTAKVPAVTQTVLAQVAAYKSGGADPSGTATLTEGVSDGKYPLGQVVTFQRVSGHSDGVATLCPGAALYGQLPDIRSEASGVLFGLTVQGPSGYVRGAATLTWSMAAPISSVNRFDILVNGSTVGTASASARSAPVTLGSGTFQVAVRAVHADGTTLTSRAVAVGSDITAPTFPQAPDLALRAGTVSTASVPVTLRWKAADNLKLRGTAVTAPVARTFPPTTTTFATAVKPSVARAWRMTATDAVGNTRAAAVSRTPVLVAETSAKKSGTWRTSRSAAYLNGKALTSTAKNAKLTFTFTGRSAALVVARGAKSGKIDVYVDGKKVGTVDLKAGKTTNRQAIWTRSFTGSAKHTVMINVLGTSGRPGVTVDGLVYLK